MPQSEKHQHSPSHLDDQSASSSSSGSGTPAEPTRKKEDRAAVLRAAWLGVGILLVITAFNTAQGYATTLYPGQGFNALAVTYTAYIFSSIGTPFLTSKFSAGSILFVGGLLHAVFILGLLWGSVSMFVCAFMGGLGIGFLWITQGFYVTNTASSFDVPIGRVTSVFVTIATANLLAGNGVTIVMLQLGASMNTVLLVMASIAAAGALMLFFIPRPYPTNSPIAAAAATDPPLQLGTQLRAMAAMAVRRPMLDAVPLILFHGALGTFAFGNFPQFLPKNSPSSLLPSMFIAFGLIGTLMTPLWGKLYDRKGLGPLVAAFLGVALTTWALTYWCILGGAKTPKPIWVAAMGMVGALDNITNCTINFSLSKWFPSGQDSSTAFGVYRLIFCLGFVSLSLISNSGVWQIILALNHILVVAAVISFTLRIRSGREQQQNKQAAEDAPDASRAEPPIPPPKPAGHGSYKESSAV
ncbi:major facilitator superfamily domain-containing protein [Catenaria anguillulae PL171]|uniref:UNC93-like protein MFSD11 n=1 Tax=Catenaria anguillulae PL171 TaxID=765915 RepID=A0A1Y2HJF2_9FUNG|nr:major facilitator superfamily domain-containing protein [Catenaria anguillulae PL171]